MFAITSINYTAQRLIAVAAGLTLLLLTSQSLAMDLFEIQVYQNDLNSPGQFGLEVHANYTMKGRDYPAYTGEQPPNHVGRLTFEPALGITEFLELGGYLQNMMNSDGHYKFSGVKLRAKFVLPRRYTGKAFVGINVEVGRVPRAVEEQGWANEFRPILGWYDGYWLFDVNPIFGYALSGSDKFKPDFEPAGKLGINTQLGFMLGAEYYAGIGYLASPATVRDQDHLLLATFDLAEPAQSTKDLPWELNVGFGKALTSITPQQWIAKAIVGRSF
jgi:hypothetical protein